MDWRTRAELRAELDKWIREREKEAAQRYSEGWVSVSDLSKLKEGDIIKHKNESKSMIVTGNYGKYVIAIRQQHVSNPDEWLLFLK